MDDDIDCEALNILNSLLSQSAEEKEDESVEKQGTSTNGTVKEDISRRTLKELDFNFLDHNSVDDDENKLNSVSVNAQKNNSNIYDDKIDSSDDEDRTYFSKQSYSEYGHEIKTLLKNQTSEKEDNYKANGYNKHSKSFNFSQTKTSESSRKSLAIDSSTKKNDIYCDPCFGIKLVTPLISSAELKDRMTDKIAVTVSKIKYHLKSENLDKDWVIAGVLIHKSPPKTSQKGNSYCIWKISDLSENMNTVAVFLFGGAYKTFWKTTLGSVIGILNPGVLESKDNTDLATLSIDNPQKIMIFGKSKDMGKCKSIKKNGDPCSSIVNLSRCEFCVYHIKQEYKKCSRRAELQTSNPLQRFSSDKSKNEIKPLQSSLKQGLQQFVPVFAKRNEKLYQKDRERLALLSGSKNPVLKNVDDKAEPRIKRFSVELTTNQTKKDFERLNKLRGWKNGASITVEPSQKITDSLPLDTPSKLNTSVPSEVANSTNDVKKNYSLNNLSSLTSIPKLGAGCNNGKIDLSQPIVKRHINRAKINAVKWVQENGEIKRMDPNKTRLSKGEKMRKGVKRPRENDACDVESAAKKSTELSNKFKEMLEAKSSHTDLIEKSHEENREKYFSKLEMKEKMEEKMLTTYKVDCKAVKCLTCKYTDFSAADICKEKNHPLRVFDAVKRFFKCSDCGNRTVSLNRLPSYSCKRCSSSKWVRTGMMDKDKTAPIGVHLSVRGDEEKFIGSSKHAANLNLLVPDTD